MYHSTICSTMEKDKNSFYHYRGELPKRFDGNVSRLARFIDNEETLSRKEKYIDLYICEDVSDVKKGKLTPRLLCLVCRERINCFYNNTNLDFTNFFNHLLSKHPSELTIKDQETVSNESRSK
jgi:hypothetical protein